MKFAFTAIIIWLVFVGLFYKFNRENFRFSSALLPLVLFFILVSIDLVYNFLANSNPILSDGLGFVGVFSFWILKDDYRTLALLSTACFEYLNLTFDLLFIYMVSLLIKPRNRKTAKTEDEKA